MSRPRQPLFTMRKTSLARFEMSSPFRTGRSLACLFTITARTAISIKTAGAFTADFGYAGMLYEPNSKLDLTLRRAYSPRLMRWLSRDAAGELSGSNLYEYSDGNPVSLRGTD